MLIFVTSLKKYGGGKADALSLECWIVVASFCQYYSIDSIKYHFALLNNKIWCLTRECNKHIENWGLEISFVLSEVVNLLGLSTFQWFWIILSNFVIKDVCIAWGTNIWWACCNWRLVDAHLRGYCADNWIDWWLTLRVLEFFRSLKSYHCRHRSCKRVQFSCHFWAWCKWGGTKSRVKHPICNNIVRASWVFCNRHWCNRGLKLSFVVDVIIFIQSLVLSDRFRIVSFDSVSELISLGFCLLAYNVDCLLIDQPHLGRDRSDDIWEIY